MVASFLQLSTARGVNHLSDPREAATNWRVFCNWSTVSPSLKCSSSAGFKLLSVVTVLGATFWAFRSRVRMLQALKRDLHVTNLQSTTATNDAVGVFLIGLPLGSMGGGDRQHEIARLKGACQANVTTGAAGSPKRTPDIPVAAQRLRPGRCAPASSTHRR